MSQSLSFPPPVQVTMFVAVNEKPTSTRFNHTLSAVLRGQWMLEPNWANAHLPAVLSMLQGNPVSFVERSGYEAVEMPFVVDPVSMNRYPMFAYFQGNYVQNPNIPPNSVAVLPISGPITKYSGECGEPGAIERNNWLLQIERLDHVNSVILLLDTPGGEVRAIDSIIPTLEKFSKPVLSYIDGMSASLGVWFTSASKEVYFGSNRGQLGSIGAYITIPDFTEYFAKAGVKIHEIYAPESGDKNKIWRDVVQGEYGLIEKQLSEVMKDFISFVGNHRGSKAVENASQWNTGKMFSASEAVKLGLADGIMSFQQVVSKATWLGKRNKI
jgi:protease-4